MSTATVPTALTPRQQTIVDLLGEGPRTMRELAVACGYEEGERRGRSYVVVALERLTGKGYGFHNYKPIGSHRGAYYVLMTRPHGKGTESCVGDAQHCEACGIRLANDHREDLYCSPCQRSMLDRELEMLAPPTLFPVSVAS